MSTWEIDGSGEVREEVVVREETLNWREVSCTWRSFCLVSDVALSILSWAIIEWREAVSSSNTDWRAGGAWEGIGCCGSEKEVNLYVGTRNSFIGFSHAFGCGDDAAWWVLESKEVVMNEKRDLLSESEAAVELPMPGVFLVTLSTRLWEV